MIGPHDRSNRPDDMPVPFRCDVFPERDRVRVAPVGELDAAVADEVREAIEELRQSGFKRIVLDLRELTFIDSTGLRLVLDVNAAASDDSFALELVPGTPAVQRIFDVTRTTDKLPFVRQ